MILRKADKSDERILFEWANDPETRANSFNTAPIEWDTHVNWFDAKLNNDDCLFYIAYEDESPCGTIRVDVDRDKKEAIISYSIAPNFRGRGLGKAIIATIDEPVKKSVGESTLIAEVRIENKASQKCFEVNNYQVKEITEGKITYFKNID